MSEQTWKWINLGAWLLAASAYFFTDSSGLKQRLAIAETKIEQETQGYRIVQAELAKRMDRLEEKIDRLLVPRR